MLQLDHWLFLTLNAFAGRWAWLDTVARLFLNDYFVPTLLAVSLILLWFEGEGSHIQRINQRGVVVATLGTLLANILLKGINLLYHRPRPFTEYEVNLLFYQPTDSTMPSNAAVIGFAIATGVWFHHRVWGRVLLIIAFLFGLSRVFGGVHFPLDVVVGAGLGGLSAWLVNREARVADGLLGWGRRVAGRLGLM